MENLTVKDGVLLTVENYWSMDYPEDDWEVEVIAGTHIEAIAKFYTEEYVSTGINIEGVYFNPIKYVTYEGKNIAVKLGEFTSAEKKSCVEDFHNSYLKADAISRRKLKNEEDARLRTEEYQKEKKEKELRQLRELKEKYE